MHRQTGWGMVGYRSILPDIPVLGRLQQKDLIQGHPPKEMTPNRVSSCHKWGEF